MYKGDVVGVNVYIFSIDNYIGFDGVLPKSTASKSGNDQPHWIYIENKGDVVGVNGYNPAHNIIMTILTRYE